MNKVEAAKALHSKDERRFLIQQQPLRLIIIDRDVTSNPDHMKIASDLVALGVIASLIGLSGGYCMEINGKLKFWGNAVGLMPSSTQEQFYTVLDSIGADILN